jgi:hypothetical protein
MADARRTYLTEIAGQWKYLPTWLPGRTVELGQVGLFDGTEVDVDGDLSAHGFVIKVDVDQSHSDLSYNSKKAVDWDMSAAAGTVMGERVAVKVAFSRANAVLFHAYGAVERRIANLGELKALILALNRRAAWPANTAVVVSVVTAASATVLISSSKGASVTCDAKAGMALGNLANPSLGLKLSGTHDMHTAIVTEGNLTPLYQALVLRSTLLGGSRLRKALRATDSFAADDPLRAAIDEDFALCAVEPTS